MVGTVIYGCCVNKRAHLCICKYRRWACATFFLVRNHNSATWRKHFYNRNSATFKEMLLRNCNSAIPQSQFFLKSATWSPQPKVRNLRVSLPQFLAVESLEIRPFLPSDVFCYWEDFKGTVARDFRPLFFSWINPIWTPESYTKGFFNSVSNRNNPNLEDESRIHIGSVC